MNSTLLVELHPTFRSSHAPSRTPIRQLQMLNFPRGKGTATMKIALTIHALHGGGAERQLAELANYLVARENQVVVVTLDRTETDQYQVEPRVQRIGLDLMRESRNLLDAILANRRRVQALRKQLSLYAPDVVLSFTDKMNIVTLASRPDAPVIIAERSDPRKQRLSRLWETWRNRTYPRAAAMVALTNPIATALQTRFTRNLVRVIPNAVAIATEPSTATEPRVSPAKASSPAESHRKYQALAVGRLSPEKGFDLLLKAWRKANLSAAKWELVIVGEGATRPQLESLIKELNLTDSVRLAGWCQDVAAHYQEADLYISSSHYEAMSRSLLEAMSHGLPILSTRATDGLEELVQENHNGWLIPTGDDGALAHAIEAATSDTQSLPEYGIRSRALVQAHAWENVGPKWLDLIQSVVSSSRKTS